MKKIIKQTDRNSIVWVEGGRLYKQQPKFLTDNEYYFLNKLKNTGYVPIDVMRHRLELISMEYIRTESVTDPEGFMMHLPKVIEALRDNGVRHGDLTAYSVLVRNNKPVIIDFSESRIWHSPIVSKRPEGDSYWLRRAMLELAGYDVEK